MEEILIKSHLIVRDIHSEYNMNWCGRIIDTKPKFKNGEPIFAIVGGDGRMELATTDMTRLEKCAKLCTRPRGRGKVASDTARIYVIDENDNDHLLGIMTHNRVKEYGQMYDKVGWYDNRI